MEEKEKARNFDPSRKPSLKGKTVEDYKRIIDVLYEELQRRDKQIDSLKQENDVLLKTAFRSQEKVREMEKLIENSIRPKNEK